MKDFYIVIKRPLITEKGTLLKEEKNQYAFEVHPKANKIEIKQAIEKIFQVNVLKVRTENMPGKLKRVGRSIGRRPQWKKAIVTLKEGDRIEFFEGV